MPEFKGCRNYTIVSEEKLSDIDATGYVLSHDVTKARIVLIDCKDDNKSFAIGFKTPCKDSTGVPHILEHSVLCGSSKYPVKDAMTEVGKGSVNTFMNAFTYPDRTLYPFSTCNDKDYMNILGVYLDAVFKPRVYSEPKIFMQEGWHYEIDNEDAPIVVNGVVYNEMKGAYSSADEVLRDKITRSLLKDTPYNFDAGGNPECIPDLSYEQFVQFHKTLYHPSNCRIILYGNMDFEEKLKFIDEEYLSGYDYLDIDTHIDLEKPFDKPVEIKDFYPIGEDESEKDMTYLSYNVIASDYTDIETSQAVDVINYALCSIAGAPLKEKLIKAGIGKDVYSSFSTEIAQNVFSIIAEGANAGDKEKFVSLIEESVREVIKNGYDKNALEAAITNQEFAYREADFGNYPKGIVYSMMIMDGYIYSDDDVFRLLKQSTVFDKLREYAKGNYFEELTKKLILDNNFKSVVVLAPSKGLQKQIDDKLEKKLEEYKKSLSKEDILKLIEENKELKKYQEMPDSPEALSTIPTLSLEDIPGTGRRSEYTLRKVNDIDVLKNIADSNGIMYFTMKFNANVLPKRLLGAASIFRNILFLMDTEHYSYADLCNEINIKTGGMNIGFSIANNMDDADNFDLDFVVRSKIFYKNIEDLFRLVYEVLLCNKFDDKKRFLEVIKEAKQREQDGILSAGHVLAYGRALAQVSDNAVMREKLFGLDKFRFLEDLLADFDNRYESVIADLKEIGDLLFTKGNFMVAYGASKDVDKYESIFEKALTDFYNKLPDKKYPDVLEKEEKLKGNSALTSSMRVQYVALAGNFKKHGYDYDSRLSIIRNMFSNDYLWNNVRILGGAYGCFCTFSRNGDTFFVSYRDPNVEKTLDIYRKSVQYLKEYNNEDNMLERYIITTVGEVDSPLTASGESDRAYTMYRNSITNEMMDNDRNNLISCTAKDIRELSKYVEAVIEDNAVCTVGNETVIKNVSDLFDDISPIIRNFGD